MNRQIVCYVIYQSEINLSDILFRVSEEILGDIAKLTGIYVICANQIEQTLSRFVFGGDVEQLAAFGDIMTAKFESKLIPAAVFLVKRYHIRATDQNRVVVNNLA